MKLRKIAIPLTLGSLILLAAVLGLPMVSVLLSPFFAWTVARPLIDGAFEIPWQLRRFRFRRWHGEMLRFDDIHIRSEKGRLPTEHAVLVIEDAELALNRRFGRLANEFVPRHGRLAGLRCIAAPALHAAIRSYEVGGLEVDRLAACQFRRWLRDTLISPVERERERRNLAQRQGGDRVAPDHD